MSDEIAVEKVTIYFTGKIVVDVTVADHPGMSRTVEEAVSRVIDDIQSEINEHLMYSDESRGEDDLVQAIHELNIWDTTSAVTSASETVREFEKYAASVKDEHGDVPDEHLYNFDTKKSSHESTAWEILPAFVDPEFEG
ncbi:hypothetical protein [Streptomyces sp. NPDC004528]|uniref:hypothetical protein n=1 Tax=Streptomyces sp. NPDC004528 TaxID=3154550 RepID=UPI0033AF294B